MDLNGMSVYHGLATMASLGLTEVMSFGCFSRWELTAMKGKGRGEWRSPHRGRNRLAQRRGEAGGEEEQAVAVMGGFGARRGGEKGSMWCGGA
jgi:hypothetical protein